VDLPASSSSSSSPVAVRSRRRRCHHVCFSWPRPLVAVHLVSYHQDDDENQHGGDDDPSDDDDHGAAQEVAVQRLALAELGVRGEGQAAQGASGGQRRGHVFEHGQDAEVVVASGGEIPNQEVVAAGWNHPAEAKDKKRQFIPCKDINQKFFNALVFFFFIKTHLDRINSNIYLCCLSSSNNWVHSSFSATNLINNNLII